MAKGQKSLFFWKKKIHNWHKTEKNIWQKSRKKWTLKLQNPHFRVLVLKCSSHNAFKEECLYEIKTRTQYWIRMAVCIFHVNNVWYITERSLKKNWIISQIGNHNLKKWNKGMVEAVEDLKIWMGNLLILSKYGGGTLPLLPPISTGSAGGESPRSPSRFRFFVTTGQFRW